MVAAVLMGKPGADGLVFRSENSGPGEHFMGAFRNTPRRMKEAYT